MKAFNAYKEAVREVRVNSTESVVIPLGYKYGGGIFFKKPDSNNNINIVCRDDSTRSKYLNALCAGIVNCNKGTEVRRIKFDNDGDFVTEIIKLFSNGYSHEVLHTTKELDTIINVIESEIRNRTECVATLSCSEFTSYNEMVDILSGTQFTGEQDYCVSRHFSVVVDPVWSDTYKINTAVFVFDDVADYMAMLPDGEQEKMAERFLWLLANGPSVGVYIILCAASFDRIPLTLSSMLNMCVLIEGYTTKIDIKSGKETREGDRCCTLMYRDMHIDANVEFSYVPIE